MTGEDVTDGFDRIASRLPEGALTPWLLLMFDAMTRLRAQVLAAIAVPETFGDFLREADEDYVETANLASVRLRRLALLMLNLTDAPRHGALEAIVEAADEGAQEGIAAWRRLVDALHFLHIACGAFASGRAKASDADRARVDPILIREVRAALPAVERLCDVLAATWTTDPDVWESDLIGLFEGEPEKSQT